MSIKTVPYTCNLSEEIQERARIELNEDASRRAEDIETLRQWVLKQQHMHARTDDEFLLRFLRNSKFSIERAKEKFDNYYTLKGALPEWYANRDTDNPLIRKILEAGIFVPLGYDANGCRIFLSRMGAYDPSKFKLEDVMKVNMLITDYILLDEQTQICGIVMISDMNKFGGSHLSVFTPSIAKKLMMAWQDSTPMRTRSLNYVNTPGIFDTAFAIVKVFMKKKMIQRIKVHGSNMESLHTVIDAKHLPKEYGGTDGTLQDYIDSTAKEIYALKDYLKNEEQFKADESKRQGKSKTYENLTGLEGTFRKLEFD